MAWSLRKVSRPLAVAGLLGWVAAGWGGAVRAQDHTGDPRVRRKMQDISGPVILLFGLTVTFAAIDWGMSLEPHWFSTIYGLIIMAGATLVSLRRVLVLEPASVFR